MWALPLRPITATLMTAVAWSLFVSGRRALRNTRSDRAAATKLQRIRPDLGRG